VVPLDLKADQEELPPGQIGTMVEEVAESLETDLLVTMAVEGRAVLDIRMSSAEHS
jgi:hypothetical protein